ncbi:MAG: hypothetical protein AAGJ83_15815, partial [Planctomycetota bacterium]
AAARQQRVELRNPCFAEYADWFPSTRHDLWCRYREHLDVDRRGEAQPRSEVRPSKRSRMMLMRGVSMASKLAHVGGINSRHLRVLSLRSGETCELDSEAFCDQASSASTLLLRGWLFRSQRIMEHREAISRFFALDHDDRSHIDDHIRRCRQQGDVVVGVHVRRGDYRSFQGGRYFYDDATYSAWMHTIRERLQPYRVHFLVCSHEPLDAKPYQGLSITHGPGSARTDLYALAETDWMIGPPSTFTAWAAFIGLKPRLELTSSDQPLEIPTFTPARAA